ncbi:putative thiol peroxidase, partial [Haemophilus influenzae]
RTAERRFFYYANNLFL